ncbi:P-loop containing nucleoside triphosphate hydrolase protein [Mycena capillaripes]|nr:P-loop containing nucleoside triphosphate hydrolase protein [Mycena capillaripes]
MSENTHPNVWPPRRLHAPSTPLAGSLRTRTQLNSLPSTPIGITHFPRTPLSSIHNRKIHRNGYETAPKTPSFIPFALNNLGHPRQKAFTIDKPDLLRTCPALDPSEWTSLAVKAGAIPAEANVRGYQVQVSNLVLMRTGDAVVTAPTGSGKSLTWTLPLLARKEGTSLVITPYTSLGLDGESSNECDGITSTFIYSEQNTLEDFQRVADGDMQVVYVCPEMLESPSFARLLHSPAWRRRLSAVYIDEAHLIYETHHWRPSYSRLHLLRHIIGDDIPFIGLSATCPALYRDALVIFAGFKKDYTLINLGNHRPELSIIVLPLLYDISSFKDLTFVLPFGCRIRDIVKTIIYCDDLELLTKMMWWFYYRLASMGLPTHLVDIIHSGLSDRHQKLCLDDFRSNKTKILLGSSKISAGINFRGVRVVIQYLVRKLTIPGGSQRIGRGARGKGETAVGIFFVEPSMMPGGDQPRDADPGIIELVQSTECAEAIMDRYLDNPPREPIRGRCCCNRCYPSLRPAQQYEWVSVNPGPSTTLPIAHTTDEQREGIYQELTCWRLKHWRDHWKDQWPSYGPKCLVSDADLNDLANHAGSLNSADDMRPFTHIRLKQANCDLMSSRKLMTPRRLKLLVSLRRIRTSHHGKDVG